MYSPIPGDKDERLLSTRLLRVVRRAGGGGGWLHFRTVETGGVVREFFSSKGQSSDPDTNSLRWEN